MRRAKIVCTLGPATSTPEAMKALIEAGMDVARLNMSHGGYSDHANNYDLVRNTAKAVGRDVGILADLQGPKIRLARFADGPVDVAVGDVFTITIDDVPGNKDICGTTYKGLPGDCAPGDRILIDDGKVGLVVTEVTDRSVVTRVTEAGTLSNNKGINLPGVAVSVPALSEKDKEDLRWALKQGVDMIALSFVRNAADLDDVHAIMDEEGIRVPVIAKVEKPQAVDNLEEIVQAFDAIMVARGDLGVELPLEQVPLVQKRAISLARAASKPVIVATQMLESMITAPVPTRAEVSDVATAVFDGADAIMLSAESAAGQFPEESVATMNRIAEEVESDPIYRSIINNQRAKAEATGADAIAMATRDIAETLDLKAIVAWTTSGATALRIARERPEAPVLTLTPNLSTARRLAIAWGVHAFVTEDAHDVDDMAERAARLAGSEGFAKSAQRIIIVAGVPFGTPGATNMVRIAYAP